MSFLFVCRENKVWKKYDVTMVGDPRQVTYHTHNEAKYKKYADGKIEEFIRTECKKIDCIIDKETLNDSYRNNQSICSYSSQLYEEYGETGTKQFEVTGHGKSKFDFWG